MKRVAQRSRYDCGAACVAMVAGVPYKKAHQLLYGDDGIDLTETRDLVLALEKSGIKLSKKRTPFRDANGDRLASISEKQVDLNFDAILATKPRQTGIWHWVVWDSSSRRILDPKSTPPKRWRYSHYLRVFR